MDERGAIVLVLIPGGCFWMGAERTATSPQSRDRIVHAGARDDEAPVNRVCLDPFFLSKFEMTQSQWLRVTGDNPSRFATDRRRPVEEVDWTAAEYTCRAVDLSLPTEAQWEYAARGGVATPWWSGTDKRSLAGAANLMDASSRDRGRPPEWPYEPWHDGYAGTAPVGAMQPNGFGLYDVIGNVWEWCRDTYGPYTEPARIGDGLREPAQSRERILRGGDFNSTAEGARVTRRVNLTPIHSMRIGLRPARRVEAAEGT
jgi:formylglycine-generating enzyme required for sulfatase activity